MQEHDQLVNRLDSFFLSEQRSHTYQSTRIEYLREFVHFLSLFTSYV